MEDFNQHQMDSMNELAFMSSRVQHRTGLDFVKIPPILPYNRAPFGTIAEQLVKAGNYASQFETQKEAAAWALEFFFCNTALDRRMEPLISVLLCDYWNTKPKE